jgi:hypothetical protein
MGGRQEGPHHQAGRHGEAYGGCDDVHHASLTPTADPCLPLKHPKRIYKGGKDRVERCLVL